MLITPTPCLVSWLLSVPLPVFHCGSWAHYLYFTLFGWTEVPGEEVASPGAPAWPWYIWTESRSLHPNQALSLVLVFLFFCWQLNAFSDHIAEQPRSVACIWSSPVPLKLSDCSQRQWGWGRFELCASNSVVLWQSTGSVHGACFLGANGSVYGTIKLTVFVCQNLMVFTQPGTNLPEMLLLSPYHTAPGAIGRSLIAQWYNMVHSEQLVGWWWSGFFPPLCSASVRTALAFGSGDNCSLGFLSPSLPSVKLRRIF